MIQMSFDEMTGAAGPQRWRHGRSRFVPPDTRFNPARAEVVLLPEAEAKAFVTAHHYSGSFPPARCRIGLMVKPSPFAQERLAGAAVYSVPMQPATISRYLGVAPAEGVELGRLVLLDDDGSGAIGFNAESWFLARAISPAAPDSPGSERYRQLCRSSPALRTDRRDDKARSRWHLLSRLERRLPRAEPRSHLDREQDRPGGEREDVKQDSPRRVRDRLRLPPAVRTRSARAPAARTRCGVSCAGAG